MRKKILSFLIFIISLTVLFVCGLIICIAIGYVFNPIQISKQQESAKKFLASYGYTEIKIYKEYDYKCKCSEFIVYNGYCTDTVIVSTVQNYEGLFLMPNKRMK